MYSIPQRLQKGWEWTSWVHWGWEKHMYTSCTFFAADHPLQGPAQENSAVKLSSEHIEVWLAGSIV